MTCTFGAAPAVFAATERPMITSNMTMGNISDFAPMMNIPTFGMCSSEANPEVASATAAAMGVLTPMPCVPATATPWAPGVPNVLIGGIPALDNNCKLTCSFGGSISFTFAGQTTHQIP